MFLMSEVPLYCQRLRRGGPFVRVTPVQGHLTYKKTHPPRTLLYAYASGHSGFLGGWAFSYGRGTPVAEFRLTQRCTADGQEGQLVGQARVRREQPEV